MRKYVVCGIGLLLSIGFFVMANEAKIPSRSLHVGIFEEYVGGDAYNYIMEANLISGEIAAARITQAIYYSTSGILFLLSLGMMVSWQGKQMKVPLPKIVQTSSTTEDISQAPMPNQYIDIAEENNENPPIET